MDITIRNTSNSESLNYTNLIIHCLGRLTEKKKRKGKEQTTRARPKKSKPRPKKTGPSTQSS